MTKAPYAQRKRMREIGADETVFISFGRSRNQLITEKNNNMIKQTEERALSEHPFQF